MEESNNRVSVTGIISIILGILSIIWPFFIPGGALVGVILGIIAIILAGVSRGQNGVNGLSTAGLILGIIGLVIFVICLVVVLLIGGDIGTIFIGLLFV